MQSVLVISHIDHERKRAIIFGPGTLMHLTSNNHQEESFGWKVPVIELDNGVKLRHDECKWIATTNPMSEIHRLRMYGYDVYYLNAEEVRTQRVIEEGIEWDR